MSRTHPVQVIGVAILLALCVPWLTQTSGLTAFLLVVNLVLAGWGLFGAAAPQVRPIQLVTFAFLTSWLCIAPVYQVAHHAAAWGDTTAFVFPDRVELALSQMTLMLGVALFGFSRASRRGTPSAATTSIRGLAPWAYLGLATVLTPLAIARRGGLGVMFSNRREAGRALFDAGQTIQSAGGLQVALTTILPGALALAGTYLLVVRARRAAQEGIWLGRMRVTDLLGSSLGMALLTIHWNPMANGRHKVALAAGSLLLALLPARSQKAGIALASVALFITSFAYPLAATFKTADVQLHFATEEFAGADFDGFQQAMNANDLVSLQGHTWGSHLVSAVLYFVPRSIWPDKAVPASIPVAESRGYVFTNLSLPFHSELLLDLGLLGMALVVLLGSLVLGRLDAAWSLAPESRASVMVPVVALSMLVLIRGPLGSGGPVFLTVVALTWLGLRRSRAKEARPRGASPNESGASIPVAPGPG